MRETIFVPHSRVHDQIFALLEELITDDSSATVNEIIQEEYRTRADVRVIRLQINFDGDRYGIRVRQLLDDLQRRALPPAEIAFLRPATTADRRIDRYGAREHATLSSRQKAAVTPAIYIDWNNTATYQSPGKPVQMITELHDQFLWEIITWMTRNRDFLFGEEVKASREPLPNNHSLAACLWLRDRPLYRAMIKEAIRRALTFPPDVYRVVKDYVLDRKATLEGYQPWRDPNFEHEAKSLQPFLNHPTVPEPENKERRAIDL